MLYSNDGSCFQYNPRAYDAVCLFRSGHDVRDEGDVVCDGVRGDEDVEEKAKFMRQTLAFNKKVSPEKLLKIKAM